MEEYAMRLTVLLPFICAITVPAHAQQAGGV
jgi:hypothetical protein